MIFDFKYLIPYSWK